MLYLRIFPGRKFRIAVLCVVAITVAYTLAAVLMTVFACKPIDKSWNKSLPGVCVDSIRIWYCKFKREENLSGGMLTPSQSNVRLEHCDGHVDHRAAD